VSIQQITASEVSQPLPPDYNFVGAFKLNVGDDELVTSAQIAINAPKDLAVGTEVFFLQKGEIPNEKGELVPIWFMEESGRVGADGMIRTSSPPWNGVKKTGEFVVAIPTFTYSAALVSAIISQVAALHAGALFVGALSGIASGYFNAYNVVSGGLLKNLYGRAVGKIDDVFYGSIDILARIPLILGKLANTLKNPPISVLTVPTYGLPYTTLANVEINPGQLPIVRAEINAQAVGDYQPVVNSVELQTVDVNGGVQPVLFLSGQNFGNSLSQLQVDLISATGEVINLQVIDSLSTSTKIAVKPTNLLPINSHGHLQVTRNYQTTYQPTVTKFKSNLANLPDEPLYKSVSLVPQAWGNSIAVFNTTNPTTVINTSQVGSPDLLLAKIPVGIAAAGTSGGPRYVAATSDGTIAYTPLESQGRVAVIDLIALQQVNTNHGAADPTIELPTGAIPFSIAIDHLDRYAYVADRRPANGVGRIYVIDINPNSATYNKHIKTISIGSNLVELAQMALSADGKSLFITAPKATDSQGHVIVVNVDVSKKNAPGSQWQKQVADITTKQGVTGVTVAPLDANHPNRIQMAITNRQRDPEGFGVITVDNGNFAQAQTTYTPLLLGSVYDYFDVNEAFSTTITQDGKYAFVAARNTAHLASRIASVDGDNRAGSNIGIIKDPLTSYAKLVAATLPIPSGWTIGLALSGDDKVLTAAYQGLGPSPGTVFMFNVDEIIRTIEHPEQFYIADPKGENEKSPNLRPHVASLEDLQYFAIDSINPAIDQIAADLYRTPHPGSDRQVDFVVPQGSKTPPIYIGNNTYSVTSTSDWLALNPVAASGQTDNLTPTLNWHFENDANVQKVNLYVSTLAQGKGLFPWDELVDLDDNKLLSNLSRQDKEKLLTKERNGYQDDYNPGRIITASWSNNLWTLIDGDGNTSTIVGDLNSFTIPGNKRLTAEQTYYWGVEAFDAKGRRQVETKSFKTNHAATTSPFSGVSILTHGFSLDPTPTGVPEDFYTIANSIIHSQGDYDDSTGLILRYDKVHTSWIPVNVDPRKLTGNIDVADPTYLKTLGAAIQQRYHGKQLVLLPEWSIGGESTVPDAGFTEAAADNLFAAIVSLDQSVGGGVGIPNTGQIYDTNGNLIRSQGDLLNSPLHFIGFSRGTVVNSEVIQRLGTFFPQAGGVIRDANGKVLQGDLQMTTIDPHDFYQSNLDKGFLNAVNSKAKDYSDFYEPPVTVWSNVTFADNYYQERGNNGLLTVTSATPNGRILPGADVNRKLTDLTGFKHDNGLGNTHTRVLAWYAGTADLGLVELPSDLSPIIGYTPEEQPIYDALGSKALIGLNIDDKKKLGDLWYKGNASAEGVGEGWFFSHLGGGEDLRPPINSTARIDVKLDNPNNTNSITWPKVSKGDGVIPTVFNGNFDVGVHDDDKDLVPGWWAVQNGSLQPLSEGKLVKKNSIGSLADKSGIDNNDKVIVLGGSGNLTSISHKAQLIPDWGVLRFDVHTQNITGGSLKVFLDGEELISSAFQGLVKGTTNLEFPAIDLQKIDEKISGQKRQSQSNRIGYAQSGFQTFQVDIPNRLRGKVATLKFEVTGSSPVYLDNVFFKSQHLLFGNPTQSLTGNPNTKQEARKDINTPVFDSTYDPFKEVFPSSQFYDNYLIEKEQYSLSYNSNYKTANWVSYQLNNSWIGDQALADPDFQVDPRLPFDYDERAKDTDIQKESFYQRGHLATRSQRSRSIQDNATTDLMSNIIPQPLNKPVDRWTKFEEDLTNLVKSQNKEIYIIAGRDGQASDQYGGALYLNNRVSVPEGVWKVVLILDKPGQGVSDVTKDTLAFAIRIPNSLRDNPDPNSPMKRIIDDPDKNWYDSSVANGSAIGLMNIEQIQNITGYNFLNNLSLELQQTIEGRKVSDIRAKLKNIGLIPLNAPLLSDSQDTLTTWSELRPNESTTIWHDDFVEKIAQNHQFMSRSNTTSKICFHENTSTEIVESCSTERDQTRSNVLEIAIPQVSINQAGTFKINITQDSLSNNRFIQNGTSNYSTSQISTSQISTSQINISQNSTSQINTSQIEINKVSPRTSVFDYVNSNEVTLPGIVSNNQFLDQHLPDRNVPIVPIALGFFAHNLTSDYFSNIHSTLPTYWNFVTPIDITFKITDLPTGQLAEGSITGYDSNGRPDSATISIDNDANGVGWFIDQTPGNNSEFSTQLTNTAYQATSGAAVGKYDLLTAILHETGHILGFINGYSEFGRNVKNGKFITDTITAQLTPDGSHLDSTLYPYDLLNTSLKPGIRKLPSQLDLAIINQLYSTPAGQSTTHQNPNAALTAGALYAIENGDFTNTTGWNLQGGTTISNGAATLSEASQKLAQLTQDLIIPTGAKRLQFTIKDNHLVLGDSSKTANDAFEVALLGTNFKPLAGTSQGLTNTDSLLNIQANGTTYKSNKVTITPLTATSEVVSIDISDITPETKATLYFNLLLDVQVFKLLLDD
jgi:large repetitive protein